MIGKVVASNVIFHFHISVSFAVTQECNKETNWSVYASHIKKIEKQPFFEDDFA